MKTLIKTLIWTIVLILSAVALHWMYPENSIEIGGYLALVTVTIVGVAIAIKESEGFTK